MISYADWKEQELARCREARVLPFLSFDEYARRTGAKEYICVVLSPDHKLFHLPQEPLLATDCLAEACCFVYDLFKKEGVECAVYQERSQGYRSTYQHSNKHTKRAKNGQFIKA